MANLEAPFVYFGGKSKVADFTWGKLGYDVPNYIEPFFGSGAMLLRRPGWSKGVLYDEVINDREGLVANFWRSVKLDPKNTAKYADQPMFENDLHARHVWLVERKDNLRELLEGDPEYHDPKMAGWWAWGMSCWIGGQFCEGRGAWGLDTNDKGQKILVKKDDKSGKVYRKRIHLGGSGVNKDKIYTPKTNILKWFTALSDRFRTVKVMSGDWSRAMTQFVVLNKDHKLTAVFLDPPYSKEAERSEVLYTTEDLSVAHLVRTWCEKHGNNKNLRIALCGYGGEHESLEGMGWLRYEWKASGGYGLQGTKGKGRANREREVIWFSPYCLAKPKQTTLF